VYVRQTEELKEQRSYGERYLARNGFDFDRFIVVMDSGFLRKNAR
jgi:hypothetical protein